MKWLALALVVSSVVGCSGNSSLLRREPSPSAQEVADLKARIVELQRRAAVSEVELNRLREEVSELRAPASGPTSPPAERRVVTSRRPAETVAEPAPIVEAAPTYSPPPMREQAPGPVRERAFDVVDLEPTPEIERAMQAPEDVITPQSEVPRQAPAQVNEPMPSPVSQTQGATPEAQALYDQGYTEFHQGRFVAAEGSFQRFLQAHSRSELADNAGYWIGESRLAREDTAGALAAFRETTALYPEGNKAPEAWLKIAECLHRMGDSNGALDAYEEVIRRFPSSAAAAVAKQKRDR